jgi:hypothetical protein
MQQQIGDQTSPGGLLDPVICSKSHTGDKARDEKVGLTTHYVQEHSK